MAAVVESSGRRTAILDAALSVFLERGVADASIEQICARAGASVGSVYHHFGDKGSLAGAVYLEALRDYQATFLAALHRAPDDAEAAVRAAVDAHVGWCLRRRPEYARFLFFYGDEARNADPTALEELNHDFFAEVRRWWRPHAHYGALRDIDLDLAYALWLGPVQEFCRLRLAGRTTLAPARATRTLADAAWRSLKATEGDA